MLRIRRARRKLTWSVNASSFSTGESLKPSKKWEKHFEEIIELGKSRRRQSKSEVDKQLFSSSSSSASSDASSASDDDDDDDDDDFVDRRGLSLPRRESIQLGSPITSPRANSMVSLPRRGSFIVRQKGSGRRHWEHAPFGMKIEDTLFH